MIWLVLLGAVLSAILYRMGGSDKWNTKWRDIGCPLVLLGLVIALFGFKMAFWWVYAITFSLSWGALTTYWDWLFGYDNFYAHGFGCGLAALLLCFVIPWWIVLIRLTICIVGMGLWSKLIKRDVPQECGRGVLFIL